LIVAVVAAAGCAHEFAYRPVDAAAAGAPASRYQIPPEAPRGEVYVTSFGFTQMDVAEGRSAQLMHARVVAVNNGHDGWTVDEMALRRSAGSPQNGGPQPRVSSPPGGSSFQTSAPRSPSSMLAIGPA